MDHLLLVQTHLQFSACQTRTQTILGLLPIKSRSKPLESGSETGSNWDESSDASDAAKKAQKPKPDTSAKTPSGPKKAVAKKKVGILFFVVSSYFHSDGIMFDIDVVSYSGH